MSKSTPKLSYFALQKRLDYISISICEWISILVSYTRYEYSYLHLLLRIKVLCNQNITHSLTVYRSTLDMSMFERLTLSDFFL